jgi:hypothetical protein
MIWHHAILDQCEVLTQDYSLSDLFIDDLSCNPEDLCPLCLYV